MESMFKLCSDVNCSVQKEAGIPKKAIKDDIPGLSESPFTLLLLVLNAQSYLHISWFMCLS